MKWLTQKIKSKPHGAFNNIFATLFGFKLREFFAVDQSEAAAVEKPVDVDFSEAKK